MTTSEDIVTRGDAANTSDYATFIDIYQLIPPNTDSRRDWVSATIQGSVGLSGDRADYYLIEPEDHGAFDVSLTGMSANLDLEVFYFPLFWSGVKKVSDHSKTDSEALHIDTTSDTQYVIGVIPYEGSNSNYELSIHFLHLRMEIKTSSMKR